MRWRTALTLVALLVLGFTLAAPAVTRADGVVIVEPPDACDPATCRLSSATNSTSSRTGSTSPSPTRSPPPRSTRSSTTRTIGSPKGTYIFPHSGRRHRRPVHDDRRRRGGRGQDPLRRRSPRDLQRDRPQKMRDPGPARIHRQRRDPGQHLPDRAGRGPPHPDRVPAGADRRGRTRSATSIRSTPSASRPRRWSSVSVHVIGRIAGADARRLLPEPPGRDRPHRRPPLRRRLGRLRRHPDHRLRADLHRQRRSRSAPTSSATVDPATGEGTSCSSPRPASRTTSPRSPKT